MSRFLPVPASAQAAEIDFVLFLVHALMLALFVGWATYFGWVIVRFRAARQPIADRQGARGNIALGVEIAVVAAEIVLLLVFALPLWFRQTAAMPDNNSAIVVRVVAEQFSWTVQYPGADGRFGATSVSLISSTNPLGLDRQSPFGGDDVVETGRIHLPIGRPAIVQLSSKDVIHSFGIPAMRVKRDVIPGLTGAVWFTPTRLGEFDIACSQLCGIAHYRMRGALVIESAESFRRFLAGAAQGRLP